MSVFSCGLTGIGVCSVVGYRVMSRGYRSVLSRGLTGDE